MKSIGKRHFAGATFATLIVAMTMQFVSPPRVVLNDAIAIGYSKAPMLSSLRQRGYTYWESSAGITHLESNANSLTVRYDWLGRVSSAGGDFETLRTANGTVLHNGDSENRVKQVLGPPSSEVCIESEGREINYDVLSLKLIFWGGKLSLARIGD